MKHSRFRTFGFVIFLFTVVAIVVGAPEEITAQSCVLSGTSPTNIMGVDYDVCYYTCPATGAGCGTQLYCPGCCPGSGLSCPR